MASKIYVNKPYDFDDRIGLLFEDLPIPATVGYLFYTDRIAALKAFVEANPDFHIVSLISGSQFNRYLESAKVWMLADGDDDPELMHVFRDDPVEIVDREREKG